MRLRHHWTPSPYIRLGLERLGTELALPMVWDDADDVTEGETITVHFGLWCVDPATGGERTVTAPFVVTSTWRRAKTFQWRLRACEDGVLVMSLEVKGSYDINYHFFTFDGARWQQAVKTRPSQQLVFWDQTFTPWDDPGELTLVDFPLSGGSLASSGNPLVFSADFTHAFSYDSGPMTPEAAEYTATLARARVAPPPGLSAQVLDLRAHPELSAALPSTHSFHCTEDTHFLVSELEESVVILDADYRRRMRGLTVVEMR